MAAFNEIFVYLVYVFFGLYLLAMLLRFVLQLVRADFYNPISQTLVKLTNPLVLPVRKVLPGYGSVDFASLMLAIILQMLMVLLLVLLQTGGLLPFLPLFLASLVGVAAYLVKIYFLHYWR